MPVPPASLSDATVGRGRVVLAVGVRGPLSPHFAGWEVRHLDWGRLSARTLARALPDAVLCPLTGPGFDALDMAQRLDGWGFGGVLAVILPPLPDPDLIRREIRATGPGLSVLLLDAPRGLDSCANGPGE